MPILSQRRNLIGDRASKFKAGASKKTARKLFLDRIMNLPDDEQERLRNQGKRA